MDPLDPSAFGMGIVWARDVSIFSSNNSVCIHRSSGIVQVAGLKGRGSRGIVVYAHDKVDGNKVALKVLYRTALQDPSSDARMYISTLLRVGTLVHETFSCGDSRPSIQHLPKRSGYSVRLENPGEMRSQVHIWLRPVSRHAVLPASSASGLRVSDQVLLSKYDESIWMLSRHFLTIAWFVLGNLD